MRLQEFGTRFKLHDPQISNGSNDVQKFSHLINNSTLRSRSKIKYRLVVYFSLVFPDRGGPRITDLQVFKHKIMRSPISRL